MDGEYSQPTQPATQNVLDPRRLGKQNSGFTDEDIADIVCLLFPYTSNARSEAARLAREGSSFVIGRDEAQNVDVDYTYEDFAGNFGLSAANPGTGPAFVLRLSASVKNPLQGFTFGRNAARCDICFNNDSLRRLSNVHFRIFINNHGVLMLQDQSTNGTVVDEVLLKARREGVPNMRTLSSGTKISILLQNNAHDLEFLVRVPRREGQYELAYQRNLHTYLERIAALAGATNNGGTAQRTIAAGPAGVVNLFPHEPQTTPAIANRTPPQFASSPADGLPREWNGSNSYNRVGQIGKGAFATVHKVTSKFDGRPYAAKELDKRRFIKDGVLDQKVENEMKIMQNIQHPNIVRYIEHFDFDNRLFIIIMEFVSGGDLGSFINKHGRLPEATVKEMAGQLIDALGYLHLKNITHRDVKPDNILIDSLMPFTVKLTDFGLSKMVDNEQTFLRTFCGTLLYCAPEVYVEYSEYDENGYRSNRNRKGRRPPNQGYDHAVDIWSLGGVLFYCLTGSPPFPVKQGTSYTELLQWIMTKPLNIDPLINANVSAECVHFLSSMLQRRPEHRATVKDLQAHPWLAGSAGATADALEQSASQLSIHDREEHPDIRLGDPQSDDEILDDDLLGNNSQLHDFVSDFELAHSQKENYDLNNPGQFPAAGTTPRQRLFGEVNVSAIGSSGVIPAERLNLPVSDLGLSVDQPPSSLSDSDDHQDSDETFLSPRNPRNQQQLQQGQQWSQPRSQSGSEHDRASAHGKDNVPAPLSQSHNFHDSHSVDELNNLTFDVASQSLGGAESILGNLNMKSLATSNFKHSVTDFTSSKRKPALDTSDELEGTQHRDKPTIKRLKSHIHTDSASKPMAQRKSSNSEATDVDESENEKENDLKDEHETKAEEKEVKNENEENEEVDDETLGLYEAVQPICRSKTGRQMDLPVHKSVYWTPGQPSSWHLQYPEMTQLQYDEFEEAATARKEEFRPGFSALWDFALRHFPPSTAVARSQVNSGSRSRSASRIADTVSAGLNDDDNNSNNIKNQDQKENIRPQDRLSRATSNPPSPLPVPLTSSFRSSSSSPQRQHDQPAQAQQAPIVVPIVDKEPPIVDKPPPLAVESVVAARLDSTPRSIVPNIAVPITESITTWGRCLDNIQVYVPKTESKVPKYAFSILLWRSEAGTTGGSEPWKDLQPWGRLDARGEAARRYHFYIATKARGGILVNQTQVASVDPGNRLSPSRFWVRLYDGDSVVVWHNAGNGNLSTSAGSTGARKLQRTELVFRCTWGGSAQPRSPKTPADLVDETTSRLLDEACLRAQRFVDQRSEQQRCMVDANRDVAERSARIDDERQRSVAFERTRTAVLLRHGRPLSRQPPFPPSQLPLHPSQQHTNQRTGRPPLAPSSASAPPTSTTASNGVGHGANSTGGSNVTFTPSTAVSHNPRAKLFTH
ncbi:serine/threonine-protein kinase-like protein [Niveomyces insectorum RCEF 264]|uniref:Autophagy-related protein 1 n=1 Tax=Niveomyces insectorum RCEF 264 TaxID=1081102 RepID=A0A167PE50_9HYPO|nr:serine/threonine-protein kinase-like protein [Niveomyces insectorum RCEF 264]